MSVRLLSELRDEALRAAILLSAWSPISYRFPSLFPRRAGAGAVAADFSPMDSKSVGHNPLGIAGPNS